MNFHEIAGVELVPAKRKNLPNRVLRAFDNAMHIQGLARGVKHTLAELCRFIPQDRPFDTVFAHKSTIADRTGTSERTIYRHLAVLQEQELIEVLDQDRKSRNGRFTVARIRLTQKAAALLAFIDAPEECPSGMDERKSPPLTNPGASHASLRSEPSRDQPASFSAPDCIAIEPMEATSADIIHSHPYDKTAGGHTLSEPTISKNQPRQRTENGLPIDLAWLTGNGLSRAGIFKLMAKAKTSRKRLSDIVTVAEAYIRDLKGGKLYAYLAKLADGPTDFSFAAATARQQQRAEQEAKAMARKADIFRLRFRNTCLTNQDQTRLYVIDERAQFAQIYGDRAPSTVPMQDLRQWIERIESGRLVMATLATERRFLS